MSSLPSELAFNVLRDAPRHSKQERCSLSSRQGARHFCQRFFFETPHQPELHKASHLRSKTGALEDSSVWEGAVGDQCAKNQIEEKVYPGIWVSKTIPYSHGFYMILQAPFSTWLTSKNSNRATVPKVQWLTGMTSNHFDVRPQPSTDKWPGSMKPSRPRVTCRKCVFLFHETLDQK